jgi:Flp pilus assembly protein TadG
MGQAVTADNSREMQCVVLPPVPRRNQRGTALVEFTLILPLLLLLTVAAVDFGRAFFVKNVVEQAAREGVRLRVVTTAADSADVRARVLAVANAANVTIAGLSVSGPDAQRQMTVVVQAQFNWIVPGIYNLFGASFTNPMQVTGRAVMRHESTS